MACNANLKRWRIRVNDECDVCGLPQTTEHLLFGCIYVKPLWIVVQTVFDIGMNFKIILGVDNTYEYDNIVTIVSFLIYKEWLLSSLVNKSRNSILIYST